MKLATVIVIVVAFTSWSWGQQARVCWETIQQPPLSFCGEYQSLGTAEAWVKESNRSWATTIFAWLDLKADPPMDVPAIQENRLTHHKGDSAPCYSTMACAYAEDVYEAVWTCADKSRILLTDEGGGKHCIKFGEAR